MKLTYFNNPKKLALALSALFVSISSIVSSIVFVFFEMNILVQISLVILVLFPLFYFFISASLEKFIYKKIKLIYKSIHDTKVGKGDVMSKNMMNQDVFVNINQQVDDWAKDKTSQIEQLKKLAIYRREFIGNLSHELKTPIFNIQGYIHTLLDGAIDDKNVNIVYLNRAAKSVERMILLVSDLEKISLLESGELEIRNDVFKIGDLIEEVVDNMDINLRSNGIKCVLKNSSANSFLVEADKEKIRIVLVNLVENAIKYMGMHKKPSIKISVFDMDENIMVEVSDNGVGVGPEDIPRLFERFFRVDKGRSREVNGTGLGLSIVKHIIERHKQSIHVSSDLNIGTTFSFTLKKN